MNNLDGVHGTGRRGCPRRPDQTRPVSISKLSNSSSTNSLCRKRPKYHEARKSARKDVCLLIRVPARAAGARGGAAAAPRALSPAGFVTRCDNCRVLRLDDINSDFCK
ncbi:hypothetical protein EVAR_52159_1 [Eumeta japonica]|uniref:Uncharacterized protein n=1 Tax=Eumeta variegata TaxID=151549 RepID=A0A4C1YCW4_EUMVA|nr:hypothetical protein EVAR_52159_1 [Eumeta japonica]